MMGNGEGTVAAEAYLGVDGALQDGWLDNMPEDTFEKDDTGKFKQGDLVDHKNFSSIVKSYLNKDKLLGTAIQPLPEKPTEEQIKAYRAKVGCPETREGYEVVKPNLPDGMDFDEELLVKCSQYAHDNHIPKGIFEGLSKLVVDGQMETFKKVTEANAKIEVENAEVARKEKDKAIETASNKLKGEWGANHDGNLEMANRFYDLPGNDEVNKAFTDLMAEKGINSHPVVVKFFHEAYKLVKEDTAPGGGAAAGKTSKPGQLDYSKVVGNSAVNVLQ